MAGEPVARPYTVIHYFGIFLLMAAIHIICS